MGGSGGSRCGVLAAVGGSESRVLVELGGGFGGGCGVGGRGGGEEAIG